MILVNEMHSEINQTNIEKIYQQFGEEMCQYHHLVPITVTEKGNLRLAMADPFDMLAQEIIRCKTPREL